MLNGVSNIMILLDRLEVPPIYYKCLGCEYLKITTRKIICLFECTNENGKSNQKKCDAYKKKEVGNNDS